MKLHSSAVLELWSYNRQRPGSMGVVTGLQSAILKQDSMLTQYWHWKIVKEHFWWLQSILMSRISVIGPRSCSFKCLVRLAIVLDCIKRLWCKGHIIHKDRQDDLDITSSKNITAASEYVCLKPKDSKVMYTLWFHLFPPCLVSGLSLGQSTRVHVPFI